jgi:oligopeptide/dipeptide ABC transporter ATP-binding protein
MEETILDVNVLRTYFYGDEGTVPAVDGLSFKLHQGETLAIVGESGCGKSVTGLSILNLVNAPGRIIGGKVMFNGENLLEKSHGEMRSLRGKDISMIFQEPTTSLNPVIKIGKQIEETIRFHTNVSGSEARKTALKLLDDVGIPASKSTLNSYPHQLSGGMCQRVMIALALALNPKIIIADEPTTALDVTIQAQILRLLMDLKKNTGASIILITHDMGVVAQMAENVMVMYAGQAVEYASVGVLFKRPRHPYTIGLLNSIPRLSSKGERLKSIEGMVPGVKDYPTGCRFSPRCSYATQECMIRGSSLIEVEPMHMVRCLRYGDKFDG